ncbi:MAG TPA: metalloregulator ArsR/SmtB family transcription factor [Dehalococcoidia bacterium]|nr:metalloregulator ArsR/SmtB family transcription factor [Dehalococcoidia bacterium]
MAERAEDAVYRLQAQVLKALAQPKRLRILDLLREGERSVGELARALGAPQANVSQHLAALRAQDLVSARREGTTVYYALAHPEVAEACDVFHLFLIKRLEAGEALVERIRRIRSGASSGAVEAASSARVTGGAS